MIISNVSDDEMKASWQKITDPVAALKTLLANSYFLGSDPYIRDLNDALLDMARGSRIAIMVSPFDLEETRHRLERCLAGQGAQRR